MTPPTIEDLLRDPVFRAKFLELLDRDPAFREEVRRRLLTEALLQLPERAEQLRAEMREEFRRVWRAIRQNTRHIAALAAQVAENGRQIAALTERMERVEAQIAELTKRMEQVEAQIAALTKRMERVEAQIAALTERMERVEAQIAALTEELREIRRTVGRIEERWGLVHEDMAEDLMPRFLALGGRRVRRSARIQFDGEADLVFEVEEADGRRFTMLVEVKGRVWGRRPFEQALEWVKDVDFRSWLRREGFPEPVVPVVFGLAIYYGAEAIATELGVGLYEARRGEVVAPRIAPPAAERPPEPQ